MNNITLSCMKGDKFEIKFDTKEQVDAILEKYKRTFNNKRKHFVYSKADLESIKEELKQLAVINECDFENEAHFRVHPETRKRRIKLIEYDDECVDFIKGIRDRKYYHDTKEWEIDEKYTQEAKEKINQLSIKIVDNE